MFNNSHPSQYVNIFDSEEGNQLLELLLSKNATDVNNNNNNNADSDGEHQTKSYFFDFDCVDDSLSTTNENSNVGTDSMKSYRVHIDPEFKPLKEFEIEIDTSANSAYQSSSSNHIFDPSNRVNVVHHSNSNPSTPGNMLPTMLSERPLNSHTSTSLHNLNIDTKTGFKQNPVSTGNLSLNMSPYYYNNQQYNQQQEEHLQEHQEGQQQEQQQEQEQRQEHVQHIQKQKQEQEQQQQQQQQQQKCNQFSKLEPSNLTKSRFTQELPRRHNPSFSDMVKTISLDYNTEVLPTTSLNYKENCFHLKQKKTNKTSQKSKTKRSNSSYIINKKLECEFCSRFYSSASSLRNHIRLKHKIKLKNTFNGYRDVSSDLEG
eukprot:Awhi_evm1s5256